MSAELSDVPETGQELEDFVAALFLAAGHFVEKMLSIQSSRRFSSSGNGVFSNRSKDPWVSWRKIGMSTYSQSSLRHLRSLVTGSTASHPSYHS